LIARYLLSLVLLSSFFTIDSNLYPHFSLKQAYVSGKISLDINDIYNQDNSQNIYGFKFSITLKNPGNIKVDDILDNYGSIISYTYNGTDTNGSWDVEGRLDGGNPQNRYRLDILFSGWGRTDIYIDNIYIIKIKDQLLPINANNLFQSIDIGSDSAYNSINIRGQAIGLKAPSPFWIFVLTICVFVIFMFVYTGTLLQSNNSRNKFGIFIAIGLSISYIYSHPYQLSQGVWDLKYSLPLHLCGMTTVLSFVCLIYPKQSIYEFLYYFGIAGAFHALLTPEFTRESPGFLFYEYFISHGGIILSALYLTFALGMRPRPGSWLKIFIYSQILIPIVGTINYFLDANYIYLCIAPDVDNPLIFTKTWPYYIPSVQFIALLHCAILYLPVYIENRMKNRK